MISLQERGTKKSENLYLHDLVLGSVSLVFHFALGHVVTF